MARANFDLIVDAVDGVNRPVGKVRRREVLPNGMGFRTVHVFAFDQHGALALQRLPSDHPRNPGLIGSSVAGYLASGETYEEAAERKIRSELGVGPQLRSIGTFEMKDQSSAKFVGLFATRIDLEKIVFDPEEIAAIVTYTVHQLDRATRDHPSQFTETFLRAYEFFRRQG